MADVKPKGEAPQEKSVPVILNRDFWDEDGNRISCKHVVKNKNGDEELKLSGAEIMVTPKMARQLMKTGVVTRNDPLPGEDPNDIPPKD